MSTESIIQPINMAKGAYSDLKDSVNKKERLDKKLISLPERIGGFIDAMETALARVPLLGDIYSGGYYDGYGTSVFGTMIELLRYVGVTNEELTRWYSKLLSGNGAQGVLDGIEWAVKRILIANCKKLFTCSLNPIIPDELFIEADNFLDEQEERGVPMRLSDIDLYSILDNCPVNENGKFLYFDAYESIYDKYADGDNVNSTTPSYSVHELWKSCDFNAYLWYVINKGMPSGTNSYKCYWDDRNRYVKLFAKNPEVKDKYFNKIPGQDESKTPIPVISGDTFSGIYKRPILMCSYTERGLNDLNTLRVYLNAKRYYRKRSVIINKKKYGFNKTVFEFNYDYVMSLKLFDTKTLVAAIVNAGLGLGTNVGLNYSIKKNVIAAKVGNIVKDIIDEKEETQVTDCYYTFTNTEYDKLLEESIRKHNGTFEFNGQEIELDYDSIIDSINSISDSANLEEKTETVTRAITEITVNAAANGSLSETDKLDLRFSILERLMTETVTQIVLQVLTPKVVILFKINSYIMGNLDPENDDWIKFMKNFDNVIEQTVRELRDIILNLMMKFFMEQIKPLITRFSAQLLLEAIRNYRAIINQLLGFLRGNGLGYFKNLFGNGDTENLYAIDNVNYADIVPEQISPVKKC